MELLQSGLQSLKRRTYDNSPFFISISKFRGALSYPLYCRGSQKLV